MRFRLNMMLLAILFAGCASTNATREDRHSEQTPDVKGVASFIIDGTSEILLVGDVGLEKGNWMKSYHTAMSELGRSFDACKSDVLLSKDAPVKLTDYKYVLWTCGDARQNTLTPQERKILIHYLDSEGRLFICGSGIGADLAANDGADFYRDFLKSYYDEKTTPINTNGTGLVAATDNSFFKDLQGRVGKGLLGRIEPYGGSESVLFYDGMGEETAAAIAYVGGFSNAKIFGRLVFMGIAWEDIQTSADRTKILDASLQYLEKAGPIRFWAVM